MGRTSDARERLLRSAGELLSGRGYADVGVQEICDRAGVKKGSFYHFFRSKRDLLVAVVDADAEFYRQLFDRAMSTELEPLQRIQRVFELEYKLHRSARDTTGRVEGCKVGNLAAELSIADDGIRRRLNATFEEWAGYLEASLREAIESGAIKETDPATSARALVAYLEGIALLAKTYNDPEVFNRLAAESMLLAGVAATGPADR